MSFFNNVTNKDLLWVQLWSFFFFCGGGGGGLFGVFFVLLEKFSLIWRRHHYLWRALNFDLCSALMAIDQWGFFSVPHLLWHGASIYIGHLRTPVTLTPIAERLAVDLSVLRLGSVAAGIRTPNLPLVGPTIWPTAPPRSYHSYKMDIVCKSIKDIYWYL